MKPSAHGTPGPWLKPPGLPPSLLTWPRASTHIPADVPFPPLTPFPELVDRLGATVHTLGPAGTVGGGASLATPQHSVNMILQFFVLLHLLQNFQAQLLSLVTFF